MVDEAADNNRISREILGHYIWSHRRVPKEWTRISLLSMIESANEPQLSAWRGLRIDTAAYPTLEISGVKDGAWLEIYYDKEPAASLNGRTLSFIKKRKNIYLAQIPENGTVTFK